MTSSLMSTSFLNGIMILAYAPVLSPIDTLAYNVNKKKCIMEFYNCMVLLASFSFYLAKLKNEHCCFDILNVARVK